VACMAEGQPTLLPRLGPLDATLVVMGGIVGSGIYRHFGSKAALLSELLERQAPPVRELLPRTSILERVAAPPVNNGAIGNC